MIGEIYNDSSLPAIINDTLTSSLVREESTNTIPDNFISNVFNTLPSDYSKQASFYTFLVPDLSVNSYGHIFGYNFNLPPNITKRQQSEEYIEIADDSITTENVKVVPPSNVITLSKYQGDTTKNVDTLSDQGEYIDSVISLATLSQEELYEDGMDNELSLLLVKCIESYGSPFLREFYSNRKMLSIDGYAFALRTIGRMQDDKTLQISIWIMNEALYDDSPIIRDAASIALSEYSEPIALAYLKKAEEKEQMLSLKYDFKVLINEMKQLLSERGNVGEVSAFNSAGYK